MSNLKMTKDRLGEVMSSLKKLGTSDVLVGIPSDRGIRKPEPGEDQAINNAALGFIHENGSPAKNIPARPFLLPGVQDAREEIGQILEHDIKKQIGPGGGRSSEQSLNAVGLVAVSAVRKKLTDGPFAPLAPATLAKRRAKGRTGTRPLVDTGQLRAAISYVVRD